MLQAQMTDEQWREMIARQNAALSESTMMQTATGQPMTQGTIGGVNALPGTQFLGGPTPVPTDTAAGAGTGFLGGPTPAPGGTAFLGGTVPAPTGTGAIAGTGFLGGTTAAPGGTTGFLGGTTPRPRSQPLIRVPPRISYAASVRQMAGPRRRTAMMGPR